MTDQSRRFRSLPYPQRLLALAVLLVSLLLVAAAAGQGAQPAAVSRPNVILIITDDQGYGDLGIHGNEKIRTPNLDRFARESVRLAQFHVMPVCSPTRACLMTGRYNYRTGVVDTFIGRSMMYPEEVTLPEMLGAAGYRTGIFGKWHLGDNYPLRAIDQGFQEALVGTGGGLTQPSDPPGNTYFDPILYHNGRPEKQKGYCTDVFTDAAIRFIEGSVRARGAPQKPFFCYLATNAPHTPLQVSEELVAPYRALGLDDTTARVYAMVTNIDDNVGRLLARLKGLDAERDTIVIFMTDNGPQQDRYVAGMRGRKGTVYEGGIRVPCYVRWPAALDAGREVETLAAHIDLLPTLLEACRVKAPQGVALDGKSLMPLLRGEAGPKGSRWPDRTLFFQWHRGDRPELFRACAARNQRFKLVDGKELYDLEADPGEKVNVADRYPEVVSQLRREYEAWFRDVSATRGYESPRIHLGARQQNPVTLTRQDWRGPRAGWEASSLGYWEVEVATPGTYAVTLRFTPRPGATAAHVKLGTVAANQPLKAGDTEIAFPRLRLEPGPVRLEAWLAGDGEPVGVNYVDVRKVN